MTGWVLFLVCAREVTTAIHLYRKRGVAGRGVKLAVRVIGGLPRFPVFGVCLRPPGPGVRLGTAGDPEKEGPSGLVGARGGTALGRGSQPGPGLHGHVSGTTQMTKVSWERSWWRKVNKAVTNSVRFLGEGQLRHRGVFSRPRTDGVQAAPLHVGRGVGRSRGAHRPGAGGAAAGVAGRERGCSHRSFDAPTGWDFGAPV